MVRISTLMLLVACASARLHAQPPVTIEAIKKAWQERQDRVKSAEFKWTVQQTALKGSLSSRMAPRPGQPDRGIVPPQDTTLEELYEASFDGTKLSYRRIKQDWDWHNKRYYPAPAISVFNGKTAKQLYPEGTPQMPWPQGSVLAEPRHQDAQVPQLRPLLMTFRGMMPDMRAFDLDTFDLTATTALIGGSRCILLARQANPEWPQKLWVDPNCGYIIRRHDYYRRDKLTHRMDVRFKLDSEHGWIPNEWDAKLFNFQGTLLESSQARVTDYTLNPSIEASIFEMEFPPGSRVSDQLNKVEYIVKPQGGKRVIHDREFGATYEQILSSEPGTALGGPPVSRPWLWITVPCLVLGVGSLAIMIYRRLSRKNQHLSSR